MFQSAPTFVDPAGIVARQIAAALPRPTLATAASHDLLTTGCVARLADQARLFLPGTCCRVSQAVWLEETAGASVAWGERRAWERS